MQEFTQLVQLMETLRSDEGCPWDRKQTTDSFRTFLLQEVYEVIEAIEEENAAMLREELGDLLFHIVFLAQISKESGHFDIRDVVKDVYTKMHGRHPHVFRREAPVTESSAVEQKWEELKKKEKGDRPLLSGVPRNMPALLRAYTITGRAAKTGFDWEKTEDVFEKMSEELDEFRKAEAAGDTASIREEIGDILFTMVNLSRRFHVDPEDALRRTINKFTRRFSYIEKKVNLTDTSLEEMDRLWNEAKRMEKKGE